MDKLSNLLERKIKILQSQLKIKDLYVKALEYEVKHKKLPPVDEYMSPNSIFDFEQRYLEKLHVVDLEIENLQLKERPNQCSKNNS